MARRVGRPWLVYASHENDAHDRCVDLFERPDGTYGFEEFRRDVEDAGVWTPLGGYSGLVFPDRAAAQAAALRTVSWLVLRSR